MTPENKFRPIYPIVAKQIDPRPASLTNQPEPVKSDRFGRKPAIAELAATLTPDQLEQLEYGTLDYPGFVKKPTKKPAR